MKLLQADRAMTLLQKVAEFAMSDNGYYVKL